MKGRYTTEELIKNYRLVVKGTLALIEMFGENVRILTGAYALILILSDLNQPIYAESIEALAEIATNAGALLEADEIEMILPILGKLNYPVQMIQYPGEPPKYWMQEYAIETD